jgi:5,10-methylenetetrahydromethanopterin reductase
VSGPKSLALAARVADGVVLAGPSTVPHVRSARESAGDRGADYQVVAFTHFEVASDPRDAYRRMAPFVAKVLGSVGFRGLPFLGELRERHARDGVEGVASMPRDWWLQIGAIGTHDDALEHLALLEAEGVTGVTFLPSDDLETGRGQIDDVIAIAGAR